MSRRGGIGRSLRFAVLVRDGFCCQYCGRRAPDVALEVDHRTPRSRGGSNRADNLVTACFDCNRGKRASFDTTGSHDSETIAQQFIHAIGRMAELYDEIDALRRGEPL